MSEEMKTPAVLHVIFASQQKIKAINELEYRARNGHLSDDRLFDLVHIATGNTEVASNVTAQYILNTTPKK